MLDTATQAAAAGSPSRQRVQNNRASAAGAAAAPVAAPASTAASASAGGNRGGSSAQPSYNSSGAGFTFEHRVATYFLLQHLLGQPCPTFSSDLPLVTRSIRLQQTFDHSTDDVAVEAEWRDSKEPPQVLVSVKRLEVIKSDKAFVSSLHGFYSDFIKHEGRWKELRFILVSTRHEHSGITILLEVLSMARTQTDFEDFKQHIARNGMTTKGSLVNDTIPAIIELLRQQRATEHHDSAVLYSHEMQWRFLSCMRMYALEMDEDGTHPHTMALLQIQHQLLHSQPTAVWRELLEFVANIAQAGGTISDDLLQRIPSAVLLRLRPRRTALQDAGILLPAEWSTLYSSVTDVDWTLVPTATGGAWLSLHSSPFTVNYQMVLPWAVRSSSGDVYPLHMLATCLVEFFEFGSRSFEDAWKFRPSPPLSPHWVLLTPTALGMRTMLRLATCERNDGTEAPRSTLQGTSATLPSGAGASCTAGNTSARWSPCSRSSAASALW